MQPDNPTEKGWKDIGLGHLSIKCKEDVKKATKESKPTILIRNDVCYLNFFFPGISVYSIYFCSFSRIWCLNLGFLFIYASGMQKFCTKLINFYFLLYIAILYSGFSDDFFHLYFIPAVQLPDFSQVRNWLQIYPGFDL